MEIKKLEQSFSVCQVEDYSLVNLDSEYCFIGKTDEEKSLVCAAGDVPQNVIRRDDGLEGVPYSGRSGLRADRYTGKDSLASGGKRRFDFRRLHV